MILKIAKNKKIKIFLFFVHNKNKSKIYFYYAILSKKCRLRINTFDINMDNYNLIIKKIEDKYPQIVIKHNKLLINKNTKLINKIEINDTIQDIIKKELDNIDINLKNDVSDILLLELKTAFENIDEKNNWKLLTLEFSNLLTYGPQLS